MNPNVETFMDRGNEWVYVEPIAKNRPHQFTVIFLHGLGESAHGALQYFGDSHLQFGLTTKNTRVIFPTAPIQAVTQYEGEHWNATNYVWSKDIC